MNRIFDLLLGPSPSAQPQIPAPQRASGGTSAAGNWGADAPLWNYLASLGTGLGAAPPGSSLATALGQGLSAGHQALRDEPERKLRRTLLESQLAQSSEKAAARHAWTAFLKTLPDAHPLRSWGPFLGPEKIADKIFARPGEGLVFDAAAGGWKLDHEWLKTRRAARAAPEAARGTSAAAPQPKPPRRYSATAPDGRKAYSDDGVTWFDEHGQPYR